MISFDLLTVECQDAADSDWQIPFGDNLKSIQLDILIEYAPDQSFAALWDQDHLEFCRLEAGGL